MVSRLNGRLANQTALTLVTQTNLIELKDDREQSAPPNTVFFSKLLRTESRSSLRHREMPSSGLIHRFLNGKMPKPEVDLVLPRDNPHKMPVAAERPTLFAIEATANEESTPDSEERVLLGTRNINWKSQNQDPKDYPRWM